MAKNTYKQDEVLEEPFDIKHLLRGFILYQKICKTDGFCDPFEWHRRCVRLCGADGYPAGAGPCNSGEKREAFIFSCGNAGRHLSW